MGVRLNQSEVQIISRTDGETGGDRQTGDPAIVLAWYDFIFWLHTF